MIFVVTFCPPLCHKDFQKLKYHTEGIIHLTGAATNSWIRFEIGTNWFNLVQFILLFYFLSYIFQPCPFSVVRIYLTSDFTYNIQLLTPNFKFTSISNFNFNFKIQLQTEISDSNFNPQFQTSTATSNIDLKHQL